MDVETINCIVSLTALLAALSTFAIAGFTLWLVIVTRGLLLEARKQFPHFKENVEAATKAAHAASENVATLVASERAYIFAEVQLDTFANALLTGGPLGTTTATVKFWNYGKTPAVIGKIRGYITLSEVAPQELLDVEGTERELPPGLGIATNCAYPIPLAHRYEIADFSDIKNWRKKLYVVGKMEYRTILDKDCVTEFCWHLVYRDEGSFITITRDSQLNRRT